MFNFEYAKIVKVRIFVSLQTTAILEAYNRR